MFHPSPPPLLDFFLEYPILESTNCLELQTAQLFCHVKLGSYKVPVSLFSLALALPWVAIMG